MTNNNSDNSGGRGAASGGDYENAPATKLVAVACACCSRPLVDSVSVESGVGPECRRRHGLHSAAVAPQWNEARAVLGYSSGRPDSLWLQLPPAVVRLWDAMDAQRVVNWLVWFVAAHQTGPLVLEATNAIEKLGYARLAVRLRKRLAAVVVEEVREGASVSGYNIRAPYSLEHTSAMRTVPGRVWQAAPVRCDFIPVQYAAELYHALRRVHAGQTCWTAKKGLFVL